MAKVSGSVRDIRITDDLARDLRHRHPKETIEEGAASDGADQVRRLPLRGTRSRMPRLRLGRWRSWHDAVVVLNGEERADANVWTNGVMPIAPTTGRM